VGTVSVHKTFQDRRKKGITILTLYLAPLRINNELNRFKSLILPKKYSQIVLFQRTLAIRQGLTVPGGQKCSRKSDKYLATFVLHDLLVQDVNHPSSRSHALRGNKGK
jgi:hypothetical protein